MNRTRNNTKSRLLALAGVVLVGAGALATTADANVLVASQEPPRAPSPPVAGASAKSSSTTTTTIVDNDGSRVIALEIVNGIVKSAKIDGTEVPADRISHDGSIIKLKDASGAVVYSYDAAPTENMSIAGFPDSTGSATIWTRPFAVRGNLTADGSTTEGPIIRVETPKAMIGVQLIEPDASIRGHFGLNKGDACLVAAVFDGLPAASAGLEPYDLIVAIDGKTPAGTENVRETLRAKDPGTAVQLSVLKKGERRTILISPETYDAKKLESAKRRAIAAADDAGNPVSIAGMPMPNGKYHALLRGQGSGGQQFTWTLPEDGTLLGVPGGPDADRQRLILKLYTDHQHAAEELRKAADEMRRSVAERLEGLQSTQAGSQNLRDQIAELERRLQQLRDRQLLGNELFPPAPGAPSAPVPPDAPQNKPSSRESFNPRAPWRASMS